MTTWLGDTETEAWETDDSDAEGLFDSDFESDLDSEDYDAESRASRARQRRARQRRAALAQRKQALAQARSRTLARGAAGPPATTAPVQRATASAIRTLDLENKVQEDAFRTAFAAQSKRMSRAEYAAVAGAAINQFIESFKAPDNAYAKAALRFSPLLLLSPQRKGSGFEGIVKDPRVIGGAVVAALVFLGEKQNLFRKARGIKIYPPSPSVKKGDPLRLIGDVIDDRGNRLPSETVTWTSENEKVASVDAAGLVTTQAVGKTLITASSGDIVERVYVEVTG